MDQVQQEEMRVQLHLGGGKVEREELLEKVCMLCAECVRALCAHRERGGGWGGGGSERE